MESFESESVLGVISSDALVLETPENAERISIPGGVLPELIEFIQGVLAADRRRAFRVPTTDLGLEIQVRSEGKEIAAEARDTSFIGCRVKLDGETFLQKLDTVWVTIAFDGDSMELEGIVRRIENGFMGLEFPECLSGGEPDPPDELRQLVANLQLRYIRARRAS